MPRLLAKLLVFAAFAGLSALALAAGGRLLDHS